MLLALAVIIDSLISEFRGSVTTHLIDIIGKFTTGRIHLTKAEEHFIRTLVKMIHAKTVGKRILFLAHTKELVEQGFDNFTKLWPEASCGKYVDDKRDKDTKVVCGSIQSVTRNLDDFDPYEFDDVTGPRYNAKRAIGKDRGCTYSG